MLTVAPMLMLLLLYWLNPDYEGVMFKDKRGQMMLGGMFVFQMLGLLLIRRIVMLKA